jgi:UDP-N-acetylglucosamine acyltransferase
VGKNTTLREYVTVNGGTAASGVTRIGSECLVMAYTHVAHDCVVEDHVILANGVQLGGHVVIKEHTVVSGGTGIHQFSTIGMGSFVAGNLVVDKNILPFSKVLGEPLTWAGINTQGLERWNGSGCTSLLKKWYRKTNSKEELLATVKAYTPVEDNPKEVALKKQVLEVLNWPQRGLLAPWVRRV